MWSEVENSCPQCRSRFLRFGEYNISTGQLRKLCEVQKRDQIEESSSEEVLCDVCGRGDEEDLLLLCDGRRGRCPGACHTFCDGLGRQVPRGRWLCLSCRPRLGRGRRQRETHEPRGPETSPPGVSTETENQGSQMELIQGTKPQIERNESVLPESSQGMADRCIPLTADTEQAGVREAEALRVKRESEQSDGRFAAQQELQPHLQPLSLPEQTEEKKLDEADLNKEEPGLGHKQINISSVNTNHVVECRHCGRVVSQRNSTSPNDQKHIRISAY